MDFGPICSGKLTVETSKGVVADRTHQGWLVGGAWNHRMHLFWPMAGPTRGGTFVWRSQSCNLCVFPVGFVGYSLVLQGTP